MIKLKLKKTIARLINKLEIKKNAQIKKKIKKI